MNDADLNNIYHFPYLGHIFTANGTQRHNLNVRMARASDIFGSLRHIWTDDAISIRLKITFYECLVISTLVYCNEVWIFDAATLRAIRGFNARCLHRITNRGWSNETTDPTYDLVAALQSRRTRWLGHILRMDETRLIRQVVILRGYNPRTDAQGNRVCNDGIHRDGDIFMCAPEHTDMADLIRQASTPPS